MTQDSFNKIVDQIYAEDPRYEKGSYTFLRQALDHTVKVLHKDEDASKHRHVSGVELLEGIREFALEQYGPLTLTVLNHWGIYRCEDFSNIVFNLIEYRVLGKTDSDKKEDFVNGYDFHDAFAAPYMPAPSNTKKQT